MRVICDTEFSGFDLTHLWCVVFRDIDSGDITIFRYPIDNKEFLDFAKGITHWVGHNFIGFDRPALRAHFPDLDIPTESITDTLVVSRYLNYAIQGGHSLEAWGRRLGGQQKVDIEDFSVFSEELVQRCVADTDINLRLWKSFQKYLERSEFQSSIRTEHEIASLCCVLSDTGFAIDRAGAAALYDELSLRLRSLDQELQTAFPPVKKYSHSILARETKNGTIHAVDYRRLVAAGYSPADIVSGRVYDIYVVEEFNPGSLKQVIERLNDAGWRPTDKTKGHIEAVKSRQTPKERLEHFKVYGWKLSEENLKTVPDTAPEATKKLTERLMLASRVSVLEQWLSLAKTDDNGVYRIHGRFQHIGAWTGRMSHQEPNMANVPKAKPSDNPTALEILSDEINDKMRSFWIAPPGRRLVGVDADGIQMRIFAHYVNDERLTKALINGSKKDETDIHSLHKRALGAVCKSRDDAKTFIYAWLLGAGAAKVSEILGCSTEEAKVAISSFLQFYPGLRELKQTRIPEEARRGYFIGLDGRPVLVDNEHLVLAGYLQSGEAVIQKLACIDWNKRLQDAKIDYKFVNFVHDEWQTEVPDDDEIADYVADTQIASIVRAGESLRLNCPLDGSKSLGYNWKDTH